MDFLNNIPELIITLLTALFAVWGGAKAYFKKIWKAIDEAEDVLSSSAELMKEIADVPAAFMNLAEVKDDGTVTFKPENWDKIKTEIEEVKMKIESWKKELTEAINAIKAVFKRAK